MVNAALRLVALSPRISAHLRLRAPSTAVFAKVAVTLGDDISGVGGNAGIEEPYQLTRLLSGRGGARQKRKAELLR